jgi:hypothetical protein
VGGDGGHPRGQSKLVKQHCLTTCVVKRSWELHGSWAGMEAAPASCSSASAPPERRRTAAKRKWSNSGQTQVVKQRSNASGQTAVKRKWSNSVWSNAARNSSPARPGPPPASRSPAPRCADAWHRRNQCTAATCCKVWATARSVPMYSCNVLQGSSPLQLSVLMYG